MKMTENMLSELRYCAEDMVRSGQKILGILEAKKVTDDTPETESDSKVTGAGKLTSLFMKETKGNKKK